MPVSRWVKVALVVVVVLVSVALPHPFGEESAAPRTYANDYWGFTITHGGLLSELPIEGETGLQPDFEVAFFDADGPSIEGDSADGVSVAVFEIGRPVRKEDPRVDNLGDFLLAGLEEDGSTDVGAVHDVAMEGCAAAVAVEFTDVYGRHVMQCAGLRGTRLYWIAAFVTPETHDDMWPVLTDAVSTFAVTGVSRFAARPRVHVDADQTVALVCDARFVRLLADVEQGGVAKPFVLVDPLSGLDPGGGFRDGISVLTEDADSVPTRAEQRTIAREIVAWQDDEGWRSVGGAAATGLDGLPAYRFEARLPDGSTAAMYAVFSGATIYYVSGYAQKSTWKEIEPLFDEAARTFDVL